MPLYLWLAIKEWHRKGERMASDVEVKARMIKAIGLAKECMHETGIQLSDTVTEPSEITAIAVLAAELFKHLKADSGPAELW
jgi:hypothetical protein